LSRKARIFFPDFNITLYDKNSESDFFFPPSKSEYFFQQHWESEYFLEKNHNPPFKLNGRSLIDKFCKKNKYLFACFVDLKKAFDTVNRQALLYKLSKYNIDGRFF
jgi:hypothetical protein